MKAATARGWRKLNARHVSLRLRNGGKVAHCSLRILGPVSNILTLLRGARGWLASYHEARVQQVIRRNTGK